MSASQPCPIARPIVWPMLMRPTWLSGVSASTRARTVSPLFVLFSHLGWRRRPIGGLYLEVLVGSEVSGSIPGVPTATTPGVTVRPRLLSARPSSLFQSQQGRGRGAWTEDNDE
jgi:hypothetical protein